jgi:hypothetical protein
MRGKRTAGAGLGVEGQIGSRRMASQAEAKAQAEAARNADDEFDRIRALLDREAAWTVETPGGGVLDSAPQRPVTASSEPKPTLSA